MNDHGHYIGTFFYGIAVIIVVSFINSCRTSNQLQGRKTAINQQYDSVVIDKDGNHYAVKRLRDNNLWMASNLKLSIQNSYHYNDSTKYYEPYGHLYT